MVGRMLISCNLISNPKSRVNNLETQIDIFNHTTELYNELDSMGIIERLREIPQLGGIKVPKKVSKTRFDYIMLQMYLHHIINKKLKEKLKYSYSNKITKKEFGENGKFCVKTTTTIFDVLQVLILVYNIGHFYNTFTASHAVIMMASENQEFKEIIINASDDERYRAIAKKIIEQKNYRRLHLLNSILLLEKCDKSKYSVQLGLEILYSYINEDILPEDSKLKYIFSLFKNVRTVAYITYDLQVANTPFKFDISEENAVILILKELLSEYNDNKSVNNLKNSIIKLLDDTVYNENSKAIYNYRIARKMVKLIEEEQKQCNIDYYKHILNKDSILNKKQQVSKDYNDLNILKLTFANEERGVSEILLKELESLSNTRVGCYDRDGRKQTILVSIKNNCEYNAKMVAAFKTLRLVVNALRRLKGIEIADNRYLLSAKFFLYYLFNENPVVINPVIHKNTCVICTRGKKTRVKEIEMLLKNSIGNKDNNHEVEFLLSQLKVDDINDTSIIIPASILVYCKDRIGKKMKEFDGMIIHPMRKKEQVIFLEAKNRHESPSKAKKDLLDKLKAFPIEHIADDIMVIDYDAYWKYTI